MKITTMRLLTYRFESASRTLHIMKAHQTMWDNCPNSECARDRELFEEAREQVKKGAR